MTMVSVVGLRENCGLDSLACLIESGANVRVTMVRNPVGMGWRHVHD
jgi:predicted aconitase